MSKLKVSGNASGTGVITLEAPNTNTDRAITLPDSAGELINIAPSTSGNVLTSDGTDWTSAAAAGGGATDIDGLSDGTTSGTNNVGLGSTALTSNTTGSWNTAVGSASLNANTTGSDNVSIGTRSLYSNTTGYTNTAVGSTALYNNTTGRQNTAIGSKALYTNTANFNTAIGDSSLRLNTTGYENAAIGWNAMYSNTTGYRNTGLGKSALEAHTTGNWCTGVGYSAEASSATASSEMTLGFTNISNLRCNDTSISSLSDERDKTNIVDIPLGLDFINTLRPVSFDWNRRDGSMIGKKDFGFIAQELKVAQDATPYAESMRLVHEDNPEKLEADPMKTFPIMVKAIQELTAKVEALEAQLNA